MLKTLIAATIYLATTIGDSSVVGDESPPNFVIIFADDK